MKNINGINRTPYNEKQEIQAYVIGVLKYNNDIRNSILNKNIGKYSLYKDPLTPSIGEYYDVYQKEDKYFSPIAPNGLLDYTINPSSKLGSVLNEKYGRQYDNIEYFDVLNPNPSMMHRWNDKYENYIKYISETYGHEIKFNEFLLNLLGENDIKYVLSNNRVGVVKDINVAYSLAGVMMTNINNLSGKDTPLGTFANKMYALTLKNGAYFNSLRKTKYITPSLISEYGNNLTNINKLSDMFPLSNDNGRLAYDIGYGNFIGDETQVSVSEYYYNNTAYNDIDNLINKDVETWRYNRISPYVRYSLSSNKNDIILITDTENEPLTKNVMGNKSYQVYSEGDSNGESNKNISYEINSVYYNSFDSTNVYEKKNNTLLDKTNKLFNNRKIGTLIGRFHSTSDTDSSDKIASLTQTAISNYGISHGRNLLKKGRDGTIFSEDSVNGYNNPYCRVWTFHHQYATIKDLIRPFINEEGEVYDIESLQNDQIFSRHKDGAKHLANNTVLGSNGFVNITPTNDGVSIKKCMFSIENLAWKDVLKTDNNISSEQIGPLGGRIMWFPPYNIKFSENSNVSWNSNDFIGRGEKIYTYVNTERIGTLSFSLLIDHPSIIDYWGKNKNGEQENEDDLLRFFAGCNTLDLSDISLDEEIDNNSESISSEPKETIPEGKNIVFYTYFPNNYTGKDDLPNNNTSDIDSLLYLFYGRGTQKNSLIDIDPAKLNDMVNYPGYEMAEGIGITVDANPEETGDIIKGKYGNWAYRIDNFYRDELLREIGNYYDRNSYSLNCKLGLQPSDATHTFAEIFTAINANDNNKDAILNKAISCGANKERIDELKNLLNNTNLKISQININGSASSHGTTNNNNRLNKDRATTLKVWLSSTIPSKLIENTIWSNNNNGIQETRSDSQSDISAKLGRCARVEIIFKSGKLDNLSDTNPYSTNTEINVNGNAINEYITNSNNETMSDSSETITPKIVTRKNNTFRKYSRYENEAEFFTRINNNEPIIKDKIVNKIKYFDPAFHSISPEGFNSRLTFLQQCTRQGHTIDSADKNGYISETAGNLAFGRPPVCVLRIGDFFYTRIIIESLSIDYDPLLWDLNPEGIGVQPMIANINLTFKFIGGGDLGGPISRLQNAVSFNYYANSSVYDDRADRVTYENNDDNKVTYNNIWIPDTTSDNNSKN